MAAEALRDQVHGYLQSQGVYDEVRAVLRERASELDSAALAGMSQAEKVRHVLREAGIVDAVVNGLASGVEPPQKQHPSQADSSADERKSASSAAAPAAEAAAGKASPQSGVRAGHGTSSGPTADAHAADSDGAFPEDEDLSLLASLAAACSADLSLRQGDGPRPLDPRRRYLRLHVQAGSAFLSEMGPDGESSAAASRATAKRKAETSFLVLHACFRGQRFRGIPVPASVSPSFDESFLMDLFPQSDAVPPGGGLRRLMASADPLQLAVTRIVARGSQLASATRDGAEGAERAAAAASAGLPAGLGEVGGSAFRVELVSYVCVEWRRVLASGAASITVELPAAGTAGEAGLSAGTLACRLELVPHTSPASLAGVSAGRARVPGMAVPEDVDARVSAIDQEQASASRRLFLAARRWWDGAVARRPDLRFRPASGRAGETGYTPEGGADAESDADSAGTPDAEFDEPDCAPWHSPFTVLAMRSGSAADHATLLCSLLRGFGLEAFVAVGTWVDARGVEGTHEWVVTLDNRSLDDAAGAPGEEEAGGLVVRFWEPLTGERSAPDWPTTDGRRFRTIACLFNEETLLANVQPTSAVGGCGWDLADEGCWMPFDQGAVAALAATLPPPPPLCPPTVAEGPLAFALEQCLRAEALARREEAGLPDAPFDARLEHSLAPALAAYEAERLTGRPFGADDFRAAVRACVPPGHSFSAFPFQVGHASPARLAAFMRASSVAEGVVCSRGEAESLAVRVRVFAYAEDVLAVWVIVACRSA